MEAESLIVHCNDESFWLYSLIWGALLPLFLAYLAAGAYAFHRRRGDIASAQDALSTMQELTLLALDRISGDSVDPRQVQDLSQNLIRRIRLEALHRPEEIQKELREVLEHFLPNAYIADGQKKDTPNNIVNRMNNAEHQIFDMLRRLTVLDALKQAWSNPGMQVSFDSLIERFGASKGES